MKGFSLLIGLQLLFITVSYGQQDSVRDNLLDLMPAAISVDELKYKILATPNKAQGDTLFYEDFGNGFSTNNWRTTDTSNKGFDWIYTTLAPGGQYSIIATPIASTTSANGFASLRSDFYNTPTPTSGFINMDNYLTSGPIVITPTKVVILQWQQSFRYCCNAITERMEVQVSTDSINWITYDVKGGNTPNTFVDEKKQLNITSIASYEDTIYVRFYQSASHYFWMIDDIVILEGIDNQLELVKGLSSFGTVDREGFYTKIPLHLLQPLQFSGEIKNVGAAVSTNPKLKVNVKKGGVMVYSDSASNKNSLNLNESDTVRLLLPYSNHDGFGDYSINYFAAADSVNTIDSLTSQSISFSVTDTVFAKDYGVSGGAIGPGAYLGGDDAGSSIGTRYSFRFGTIVSTMSFYVSPSTLNVGAVVSAKIWGFDPSQSTLNGAFSVGGLKQSSLPYTIQASDLGTWVTLNVCNNNILPAGMYVAAIEQLNNNTTSVELSLGRSINSEYLQPNDQTVGYSSFVYTAGSTTPEWNWITALPMIRINTTIYNSCRLVSVNNDELVGSYTINPNPSDGHFRLEFKDLNFRINLSIRNVIGQVVYNEDISVNNTLTKNIDLSNLDKGVYFVSLDNGVNREVQKVIIK
ncbi:T9SS type A sorting domain-containing protein [bacterium]|nr:T9SS type A sorting domain-containing protein [bacterium]